MATEKPIASSPATAGSNLISCYIFRGNTLAWVIFGAGLLATGLACHLVKQNIEEHALTQFGYSCDQVTLKIQERLGAYKVLLRAGAALFAENGIVSRQSWRSYVEMVQPEADLLSVQGIGFAEVIPPDQLASHVSRVRGEGFPAYTVWPSGHRAIYTSITYLEPLRDLNLRAFGFDMFSEPVRRAAMTRARDTGEAALSGKVKLVQETGADVQAGALLYVPVYRNGSATNTAEQKQAALIGWVYSPYRINNLMRGILANPTSQEGQVVNLRIYDGPQVAPASLLFDSYSSDDVERNTPLYLQRRIDFGGRQWLLAFNPTPSAYVVSYASVWTTLIGGLALSSTLFALILSALKTRIKAQQLETSNEELLIANEEKDKRAVELLIANEEKARRIDELAVVKERFETANKELEAFTYSVSHDLRAPLRAIDGFSRKVITNYADKLDDEGRRQLQVVRDEAQRMGQLIDDLLSFSRMGRREIALKPLDMDALVRGVADELRITEPERLIEFAFAPLPPAPGDFAMLRQVWANLLGNAVKFTRQRAVAHIEVGGRTEGGEAIYWVKDNGAGFDMRYSDKLFGVFQRLHRQDEFEGTGVGLAVAQRILRRHNGRISGEGKPDAGAVFTFSLPLTQDHPSGGQAS